VEALAAHDKAQSAQVTLTHIQNLGRELVNYLNISEELLNVKGINTFL
jgi:DNA-binding GntR family transcriptional regulator